MSTRKRKAPEPVRPRTFSPIIQFPDRAWEQGFKGGWTSRAATAEDRVRRYDVALLLGMVMPTKGAA